MGKRILGLSNRGLLWTISSSVYPILALLLSINSFSPETFRLYQEDIGHGSSVLFVSIVALVSLVFVLFGFLMFRYTVVELVRELKEAANRARNGDLDVQIESCRNNEFGEVANEFNRMINGLREKQHLMEVIDRVGTVKVAEDLTQPKL